MCMSKRQPIILTPFPSCSLVCVGAQGDVNSTSVILAPILLRSAEHVWVGRERGL